MTSNCLVLALVGSENFPGPYLDNDAVRVLSWRARQCRPDFSETRRGVLG